MARKVTLALLGAFAVAIALEIALRVLPTPEATFAGRYIDESLTTYPPRHEFRTATGWSLLNPQDHRANDYGFIPDEKFAPSAEAIALIGDSLVEQSMLPVSQRLASLLREARNGAPVFSMGVPGSSLFDYLERARFASRVLGVNTFWIVVETADVQQSRCDTGVYTDACLARDGTITRVPKAPRSALRDALAQSALLQYFVGVLRLSPERLIQVFHGTPRAPRKDGDRASDRVSADDVATIDRFLKEVTDWKDVRIGLLIDPGVGSLKRMNEFRDRRLRLLFERAVALGVPVVHPYRTLADFSSSTHLELRVGPYDGHWNVMANCIVASAIVQEWPTAWPTTARAEPVLCTSLRTAVVGNGQVGDQAATN